jgi:hypothetical protein
VRTEHRLAREATERLLPPHSPEFFDELWSRIEVDSRVRRRRRHRLVAGVVAATAAAVAAAAVYAAPVIFSATSGSAGIDRTYSCRVQVRGGAPAVDVGAEVSVFKPASLNPTGKPGVVPGSAGVTTARKNVGNVFVPQVSFRAVKNSFTVDRTLCRRSSRHVALQPAGLASNGTATPDFEGGFYDRCVSARRVLVRVRLSLQDGVPARALLAVRNDDVKSRPIAFVRWSPSRVTSYLAASCTSVNGP